MLILYHTKFQNSLPYEILQLNYPQVYSSFTMWTSKFNNCFSKLFSCANAPRVVCRWNLQSTTNRTPWLHYWNSTQNINSFIVFDCFVNRAKGNVVMINYWIKLHEMYFHERYGEKIWYWSVKCRPGKLSITLFPPIAMSLPMSLFFHSHSFLKF